MIRYTCKYINLLSLFISIMIFSIINFTIFNFNINKADYNVSFSGQNLNEIPNEVENVNLENNIVEKVVSNQVDNTNEWSLEIPIISLKANISEGTTKEVMDTYIGHFEESPRDSGNICLAAHNRGYENNYFANLKKLKKGDEIIYRYKNVEKRYIVQKHEIIKDTDWTNLENTEENMLTLITCVENEPEFRRCIQAEELK